MSDDVVITDLQGGVRLIRLNRPERANSLTESMLDALLDCLGELAETKEIVAVVITGTASAFCAGGDLEMLTEWQALTVAERQDRFRKGASVALRLSELPIPVVAAVNGVAAGAGFDLALGADVCLAARSASFKSGFVAMGLVPDLGGSWLLPRIVGLSRARRLVLGGERIDAVVASEWGIVARVVDDASLIDEALSVAAHLAAAGPRPAYLEAKRAMLASTSSFGESLEHAAMTQGQLMDTAEHRERVQSFFARTR